MPYPQQRNIERGSSSSVQDGISKEQENLFILDQALEKAIIRAVENRMIPIDNLVLCIWAIQPAQFNFRPLTLNTKLGNVSKLPLGINLPNPFMFVSSLSEKELKEAILEPVEGFLEAISFICSSNKKIRDLESSLEFSSFDYWNSIKIATKYFITKKASTFEHSVVHQSVIGDIREIFKEVSTGSSSPKEQIRSLSILQTNIKVKLHSFDPTFWDAVLHEVEVFKAKTLLFHQSKLFNKSREASPSTAESSSETIKDTGKSKLLMEDDHPQAIKQQIFHSSSKATEAEESYGAVPVISFDTQGDLSRKFIPRYVSRVFSGFDWNRYNQTHYDSNNPPPKYVQGYKFIIFYPRLLEMPSGLVPSYELADATGKEILSDLEPHIFPSTKPAEIITFTSPPPYVNISFKIIKDVWECSHRRDFKCYYEKGLLFLEFHFKRNSFRR
ncbi:hypothetical protein MDAP_002076 [Mitosporidium daphniae]